MLPLLLALTFADNPWLTFDGAGPKAKHVVLISGDDEYRSEEALPQLARILSTHHGLKTTVLFAIDPKTGYVKPDFQTNIPGMEALKTADLCVLFLRFRNLPDEQMKHLDDYLAAGKPIMGLRTSTHPFNVPKGRAYHKWTWTSSEKGWELGFGKQVFGETWHTHHGRHGSQSTRGVIVEKERGHPIVRGIKDGDIWGPTDVYGVRPLPGDSRPLVLGQVLKGMKPTDPPVEGKANDPLMPIAWLKSYHPSAAVTCKTFCCTCCSSQDLESAGLRRLLVNATYFLLGMEEKITDGLKVDLVGEYRPTPFGFGRHLKDRRPADFAR